MKYTVALLVCLMTLKASAQGWYRNLEKYWWYRYRLVNDFMKVGPECGESTPADCVTHDDGSLAIVNKHMVYLCQMISDK